LVAGSAATASDQYNYLTTLNDQRTAIDGLKGIRALMHTSAMKPFARTGRPGTAQW
jgi:hypothetical protein